MARVLATASGDNTVKLWDYQHRAKQIKNSSGHTNEVMGVSFSRMARGWQAASLTHGETVDTSARAKKSKPSWAYKLG
jgi:WD40 repeat protein